MSCNNTVHAQLVAKWMREQLPGHMTAPSPVIVGVKLLHCKAVTEALKGDVFTGCLVALLLERLGVWPTKGPSVQILQLQTSG